MQIDQIGLGGSCHWCTEAIFQSLKGVEVVKQGWLASDGQSTSLSEGILIEFDPKIISLEVLAEIHLYTHSCTSQHSMRGKYRSAFYYFTNDQLATIETYIARAQNEFENDIITQVLPFRQFKLNDEKYLEYYAKNPNKPFCENYINPKLTLLLQRFSNVVDNAKLQYLN